MRETDAESTPPDVRTPALDGAGSGAGWTLLLQLRSLQQRLGPKGASGGRPTLRPQVRSVQHVSSRWCWWFPVQPPVRQVLEPHGAGLFGLKSGLVSPAGLLTLVVVVSCPATGKASAGTSRSWTLRPQVRSGQSSMSPHAAGGGFLSCSHQ